MRYLHWLHVALLIFPIWDELPPPSSPNINGKCCLFGEFRQREETVFLGEVGGNCQAVGSWYEGKLRMWWVFGSRNYYCVYQLKKGDLVGHYVIDGGAEIDETLILSERK